MSDLSDVIRILPTMKSGNELLSALEVLPEYPNDREAVGAAHDATVLLLNDSPVILIPLLYCQCCTLLLQRPHQSKIDNLYGRHS
mgnify:CR=1 FL=1